MASIFKKAGTREILQIPVVVGLLAILRASPVPSFDTPFA